MRATRFVAQITLAGLLATCSMGSALAQNPTLSRWVDYDVHLGSGYSAPEMRQVKAGVEDLGSDYGHFGALRGRRRGVVHMGIGATYRLFRASEDLPQLRLDFDYIMLSHPVNYIGPVPVWALDDINAVAVGAVLADTNEYITASIPVVEGVATYRIAPALRMSRMTGGRVSFYGQFGPAFHLGLNKIIDAQSEHAFLLWHQDYRNFLALTAEMGFGYRNFFVYGSYDHGLTPYGYGRYLYGPSTMDMIQKYRVARVGISYHPGLTKRLRKAEEALRRGRQ